MAGYLRAPWSLPLPPGTFALLTPFCGSYLFKLLRGFNRTDMWNLINVVGEDCDIFRTRGFLCDRVSFQTAAMT